MIRDRQLEADRYGKVSKNHKKSFMKVYLTKQNRTTTDFILFEVEDKLIYKSAGKVGKSGTFKSTSNAGSKENAFEEIKQEIEELAKKGYIKAELPKDLIEPSLLFDKAKWHLNDDFPEELDKYQSYIHTGLYICWLLHSDLYESEFKSENQHSINQTIERHVTPVNFYADQLDGVFDATGLKKEAIEFTADYFDFENGQYIEDYSGKLDPENKQPSIFHFTDSWSNYDKIKSIIDKRFSEWKETI